MQFIDDEFIIVIDEPCHCLHTIWDLDHEKTILHSVKEEGLINNINLIHYKRPTSMKGNKKSQGSNYSDTCLEQVKKLLKNAS